MDNALITILARDTATYETARNIGRLQVSLCQTAYDGGNGTRFVVIAASCKQKHVS